MSSYHYLYRITNLVEQKHYYGIRTSRNILPHQDLGVKYFSSSLDKEFIKDQKEHPENYRYKVIIVADSRKRVVELEIKIHNKFNVGVNPKFYNKTIQTSSGFDVSGKATYKDKDGKLFNVSVNDPRIGTGELQSMGKGMRFIHNLETKQNLRIKPNEEIPYGWEWGLRNFNCKEISSPFKGTRIIHNPETKQNLRIKPNEEIPVGWECGQINEFGEKVIPPSSKGSKWIYNLESKQSRRIKPGEILPEGWEFGTKITQLGGRKWIYNPEKKTQMLISVEDSLPEGWFIGQIIRFGSKWIHNPETQKEMRLNQNDELPKGFCYGRMIVKGNRWIFNPETKISMILKPEEILPEGWVFGRGNYKKVKTSN